MKARTRTQPLQDDPLTLREYSTRPDLVPPGGALWWTTLAIIFFGGGISLAIFGPNKGLRFVGLGLCIIACIQAETAIRVLRIHARWKRLIRDSGGATWARDYPWDPTGHSSNSLAMTLRYAFAGLFFFVACNLGLLIQLGWHPWPADLKLVFALIIAGILSLLLLYFLTIKRIVQYTKFGSSRLAFSRVPYRLGESLEAQLIPGGSLPKCEKLILTLRCIQPVSKTTGRGKDRKTLEVYQQLYADRVELNMQGWRKGEPPIPVKFALPDFKLTTQLSVPMADLMDVGEENPSALGRRYWEIEVRGRCPGFDYRVSFLVPIYGSEKA